MSVPHSGRDYPNWLVADACGGIESLEPLEDPLVDRLAWRAIAAGHGAVVAQAPRAAIDCNRAPDEVDPTQFVGWPHPCRSRRAAAGLGIIPTRTASHGRLWRSSIRHDELQRRISDAHAPFHGAIEQGLARIAARHGAAVLLDCHSMPHRRGQAELVIGNRHGTSASPWLADAAARIARAAGWTVALNAPYAGGHVVERHGDPLAGIHALQLEIDRRCYLAPDMRSPGPGFDRAADLMANLAAQLGQLAERQGLLAAE
ncbi:N-formylglutamate amidohydrolase [Sphingomonas mesophila]|uniref:N-formylglutamate amidohydrolase n=1 Tax=Sphingomonas mesophila TaxID=2303576 RepID=UPI0023DE02BD|nr:N-formylglutamate amidohydrolase [Sphingomonas mesophila]